MKDWKPGDVSASEITPESLFLNRRAFLKGAAAAAAGLVLPPQPWAKGLFDTDEKPTPLEDITHYNNFYEFGTDKYSPSRLAPTLLKTRPWTVAVEGECKKPKTWDIDALLKRFPPEERIYRLRCVEAWSAVAPWTGLPLAALLKAAEPTAKARFVTFISLLDPAQMPGQKGGWVPWPYQEALRLDEAMNPLAFLATGLYGNPLPNQNGAPIRLVVPWKYGFKSAKSVVRIRFDQDQPKTTWSTVAPDEYGFYSNVNPEVDHPRWSQATERRLGDLFKRKTLMFNGYADQVASLYKGMDLAKNF